MSARRKGKPQQRKQVETEPEQDYLTCGDCQGVFLLSDIVKFIDHKVNRCNKENVEPFEDNVDFEEDDDDGKAVSSVISTRRTSISAPIARKGTPELRDKSPKPSLLPGIASGGSPEGRKPEEAEGHRHDTCSPEGGGQVTGSHRTPPRPKCVDAESNTTNTEPNTFMCGTCKATFGSAWNLLQHVQNIHAIKVYQDPTLVLSPAKKREEMPMDITPKVEEPASQQQQHHHQRHSQHQQEQQQQREDAGSGPPPLQPKTPPSAHAQRPPNLPLQPHQLQQHQPKQHSPRPGTGSGCSGGSRTPPQHPVGMDMLQHHPPPFPIFRMPMGGEPSISPAPMNHGPFSRPPHNPDFRIDLMNDPFHRMQMGVDLGFPPPGIPGFPNPFDRMRPPISEALQDIYSRRLRELAGTSTSPTQIQGQVRNQQTPPFSGQAQPPAFSVSPPEPSTPTGEEGSPKAGGMPGKLKACEFCGKCFRFQSNLIVHRRSHTGEKPFKCPLCPHACTQASKLKRHMKTHTQKGSMCSSMSSGSTGSDNSIRSGTSTPDSKLSKLDSDEEDEEEEEEEDEEACLEEVRRMGGIQDEPTDLSTPTHKSAFTFSENSEEPTDLSIGSGSKELSHASLLREVMEHTGLNNISHYNEAYKAALAERNQENNLDGGKPPKTESSDEVTENGHSDLDSQSQDGHKSTPTSQESDLSDAKRIKLEPPEQHFAARIESMYSHIWFPPSGTPRDYFLSALEAHNAHHHMVPTNHGPGLIHENGIGTHESAFKLDGSPKANTSLGMSMSPLAPVMASTPPTPTGLSPCIPGLRKERGRNDTCEFCGKIFKNCSNLTVHRRSHTGEKPYKCQMCNYACAQSSKLTRHMKTHGRLGKDVYRCKFCSMPFSVPSTLEKHMRKCVENQQHPHHHLVTSSPSTASTTSSSSLTPCAPATPSI